MTLLRNLDTVWELICLKNNEFGDQKLKKNASNFRTEGNISIIAAQCYSYRKDDDQTANHFGQRPLISPFDISINRRNGRNGRTDRHFAVLERPGVKLRFVQLVSINLT